MGYPRIYPTGTTIYDPKRFYNGLTIFPSAKGALLIDMDGNEVQLWAGLSGFPNKILPGGYVLGSTGERDIKQGYQDELDLVQVDWDGNIVWRYDQTEEVTDPGQKPTRMARQHHDFEREGSTTGYYAPGMIPQTEGGNTLILTHENLYNHNITDKRLLDDKFVEVDWSGNTLWQWRASDHFNELGFNETQKNVLFRDPSMVPAGGGMGDWLHINCLSTLGPNRWYDNGDERFNPDNIIWDSRNANILAITSKKTGEIVWRIGPNFDELSLGQIIGQHHFHMIPKGLPGEGNLLMFDNGGWAGYGAVNGVSEHGTQSERRDYSRILETDPTTLDIKWQYTAEDAGENDNTRFFSPYISAAQRLPNGNTLITEGSDGRIFEVTPQHKTVWEYINPYYEAFEGKTLNMTYRAYRVPYEWVPQVTDPQETEIQQIEPADYHV
ncbi:thioredoxin [Secundilactobacillus paracollinoides]|nr:aryl-sulfate sulfotransferase [Secundilactobacillus paracollinoides]ANZ63728.1 thioredoxin [Secundilactobacillus paracollinoides]KRL76555.1 hypothetical protein FC17_GL002060 [Secundilactobacillus paracollinoides DSM 15502 = JCM 11969]